MTRSEWIGVAGLVIALYAINQSQQNTAQSGALGNATPGGVGIFAAAAAFGALFLL